MEKLLQISHWEIVSIVFEKKYLKMLPGDAPKLAKAHCWLV